jgi:putative flippase GtrA
MKWLMNKLGVEDTESFWKLLWQIVKFGLVGVSNTVVSMVVYYIFLWIDEDMYMVGSIMGTIISILNAFIWNDLFVFTGNPKDFKSVMLRLGKTYVSYGGTSLLSMAMLWIEVNFFGVDRVIAPIVNLLITIPLNYLINKFWTFKNK